MRVGVPTFLGDIMHCGQINSIGKHINHIQEEIFVRTPLD